MRIIFFGTGSFAVPSLERMARHVVLAVSQPDRPGKRGMKLQASPVKVVAGRLGIDVATPERSRSPEFVESLVKLKSDFLLVASYGQILSEAVLHSALRGGINLHASLLPKYRGAAPIQRAILTGETETGVTLMQMDRGMDTGDIIDACPVPIGADETYGQLQNHLAKIAADMVQQWAPAIAAGDYPRTPQDSSLATVAPKVAREETEVRLERPASQEVNRFRAFTPAPGTYLETRFGRLKLVSARASGAPGSIGEILALDPAPCVACSQGSLELLEVQLEGRHAMPGRDWANGMRLRIGDNLLAVHGRQ